MSVLLKGTGHDWKLVHHMIDNFQMERWARAETLVDHRALRGKFDVV